MLDACIVSNASMTLQSDGVFFSYDLPSIFGIYILDTLRPSGTKSLHRALLTIFFLVLYIWHALTFIYIIPSAKFY
jgi:hypothetical protein